MSNSLRQRPPSATSSAPVGHAGTSTSGGGSTSTRTSVNVSREALADAIHDPAPRLEPYHRLFGALLFLTVITGTLISIVTYGTAVTSFRGRLPSPSSKIAFHSSYLPGALSSLPLPNLLPNYFANKRNIFNVVFVKRAWGWTTLAWGLHWLAGIFAAQQQSAGGALNTSRSTRKRLVYRPLKRYALATVYWLLFTTWFFGPSISDRLLVLSGAQCVPSSLSSADASAAPPAAAGAQTGNEPNHVILDHSHCTFGSSVLRAGSVEAGDDAARGASSASGLSGKVETPGAAQHRGKHGRKAYWKGGHDISGHSFLLTLSSLFLATEIAPTLSVLANGVHSGLTAATGAVAGSGRSTPTGPASRTKLESLPLRKYTALATVALITLWWWMLLMTSLYFHTPQEKISGFAAGMVAWWSSYALAG